MPVIAQTPTAVQPFFPAQDPVVSPASVPPETVTVTAPADKSSTDTDDTGKTFFQDLLDVVNPLEHLPIVSTIYSNLTGDKPNDFTQVAGDTLYGGALGFLSSVGNLIFKDVTGKTVGDTVWSLLTDDGSANTRTASNAPQTAKPSTDMFSFLHADAGNADNAAHVAANTGPAASAASSAASSSAVHAPAVQSAPTASGASADASAPPRILNPLPARGAQPVRNAPSENVRAAGMAQMIASRAHLHAPASEGNLPAMKPAAPVQATSAPAPVASAKPATVPVGDDGIPTLNGNGEQALLDALNKNGISGAIGQQALMAYQKTMAMSPDASNAAALTSAMTLH